MFRKSLLVGIGLFAFLVGACGGGEPEAPRVAPQPTPQPATSGSPACSPEGGTLHITAEEEHFDKDCLAAPADQGFIIKFDNKAKGIPHNVAIESSSGIQTFFNGKVITGVKSIDYRVEPLPAGTYHFECDVHPSVMNGTFVVS